MKKIDKKEVLAKTKGKRVFNKRQFVKSIVIMAIAVYAIFNLVQTQFLLNDNYTQQKKLSEELAKQQKIAQELNEQQAASNTDEYYEKQAREKLGYVKANEKLFVDANGTSASDSKR
jgi:cell division protein FtsB